MTNPTQEAEVLTVVIDQTRLADGSDRVTFRGVFAGTLPDELAADPPEGTRRQRFDAAIGWPVAAPLFRFVTVHREVPH